MRCTSALAALLLLAASGCTLVRTYAGNELPPVVDAQIVAGKSTKADVLRDLGPPDRLLRQYDGDVFVYACWILWLAHFVRAVTKSRATSRA